MRNTAQVETLLGLAVGRGPPLLHAHLGLKHVGVVVGVVVGAENFVEN